MNHLKKFETFHYSNLHRPNLIKIKVDELRDFCETYLAYLMDDAIKELKVGKPQLLQTEKYVCYNVEIYFNEDVHWNQIKDNFLPFLQMVQKQYVLREDIYGKFCSISWRFVGTKISVPREYTLEELLDDKLETNFSQSIRTFSSDEGFHGEVAGNVMSIKLEILEEVERD